MGVESHGDTPQSVTDHAAGAGFDAIDEKLRELGQDPGRAFAVVMVLIPDGQPTNATVAASMPGDCSVRAMVEHAVSQLAAPAREIGYEIHLHSISN